MGFYLVCVRYVLAECVVVFTQLRDEVHQFDDLFCGSTCLIYEFMEEVHHFDDYLVRRFT